MPDIVNDYIKEIEQALQRGDATEHTHRPALKSFIESIRKSVVATNEPRRSACGAPDYSVSRNSLTVGYIEAKDVGKPLNEAEKTDQLKRYRSSLSNLILTDYVEFRWYVDDSLRKVARIGHVAPDGKIAINTAGKQEVIDLLQDFLLHEPEPIDTPLELAGRMARLTRLIHDIITQAFETGLASDLLKDLRSSFAKTLLPDLDEPENIGQFADMYAQTIAYGLFAARQNHKGGPGTFRRLMAAAEIPKTNPFLRRLFQTITGTDLNDEPYAGIVDDLVQLLSYADMGKILEAFGKRTRQEDPIVHFYETFLKTYDPALREMRGVYYTPEPVVSFIVRSVDYLLKKHFKLSGGLADTAMVQYDQEVQEQNEESKQAEAPKVLVLDPACGTGTFLYSVIDHIRDQFRQKHNAGMWSGYVEKHLLPRLFGFELLMAPYAVAHLKLAMQLAGQDLTEEQRKQWAYDFSADERLNIYLTNTLEHAEKIAQRQFRFIERDIAEEAAAANRVKQEMPVLVVLGNPPYSGHSANRSWVTRNGKRRRTFIGQLLQDYYKVEGKSLGERNPKWLQDDYVKFIRWAQWRIEKTGGGVLAFITNHGYLDNPTFRGMRQQLMEAFTDIYILNLHGNAKKKETAPNNGKDENVFDIMQGVAIGLFVKQPKKQKHATVHQADLWGKRKEKYSFLNSNDVSTVPWDLLQIDPPYYLYKKQDKALQNEYEKLFPIPEIFTSGVLGYQSHRDHFAVGFEQRISDLRNPEKPDNELREKHNLQDNRDWHLDEARDQVARDPDWKNNIIETSYRPFDFRWCYYSTIAMDYPRRELIDNVAFRENLSLNIVRQTKMENWQHALVADKPAPAVFVEVKDGSTVFPLYLYPNPKTNGDLFSNGHRRHPNLNHKFIAEFEKKLGMSFIDDGTGDLEKTFGPEDVFNYIYAIFHSPTYRERYVEFLKIDFPRVPLTSDAKLFARLCNLGQQLVTLHLMEPPLLNEFVSSYPIAGSNKVEKKFPQYFPEGLPAPGSKEPLEDGRVYINRKQYFEGISQEIWDIRIGGYQVCEKWLKDRRGRELSYDDLEHYQKIVVALQETVRLMEEIDEAIPDWPME